MSLFNLGKKKNDEKNVNNVNENKEQGINCEQLSIKILGSGCDKCDNQVKYVKEAVAELKLSANIEHVEDLMKIIEYGVMSSPAIVIDEKVVSVGRVLKANQVVELLKKEIK